MLQVHSFMGSSLQLNNPAKRCYVTDPLKAAFVNCGLGTGHSCSAGCAYLPMLLRHYNTHLAWVPRIWPVRTMDGKGLIFTSPSFAKSDKNAGLIRDLDTADRSNTCLLCVYTVNAFC